MAEETHISDMRRAPNRRKLGKKKGGKGKKNVKMPQGSARKAKIDPKMKKLFRRRARDYNSDDDEDQLDDQSTVNMPRGSARNIKIDPKMKMFRKRAREHNSDSEEEVDIKERSEPLDEEVSSEEMEDERDNYMDAEDGNSDEYGDIQPGVTKLTEGCRAFKMAFKSIMKRTVGDETLGPVLSAHKKLVIEKLAEEEAERKIKGEAKKEKHLVAEKGHVKPANYLDSHEKFLIGVATKGVVKLFNAVNKAQSAQKGLNPSRSSDAKVIKKRRKEAFFSELGKKSSNASTKDNLPKGETGEGPSWAPLRDNYMLTNSKLKDWDKKPDTLVEDDIGRMSEDSSSDDE